MTTHKYARLIPLLFLGLAATPAHADTSKAELNTIVAGIEDFRTNAYGRAWSSLAPHHFTIYAIRGADALKSPKSEAEFAIRNLSKSGLDCKFSGHSFYSCTVSVHKSGSTRYLELEAATAAIQQGIAFKDRSQTSIAKDERGSTAWRKKGGANPDDLTNPNYKNSSAYTPPKPKPVKISVLSELLGSTPTSTAPSSVSTTQDKGMWDDWSNRYWTTKLFGIDPNPLAPKSFLFGYGGN